MFRGRQITLAGFHETLHFRITKKSAGRPLQCLGIKWSAELCEKYDRILAVVGVDQTIQLMGEIYHATKLILAR